MRNQRVEQALDRLERPVGRECGFCLMHPVNDAGPGVDYGHMPDCPVWIVACETRRLQRLETLIHTQPPEVEK